VLRYAVSDRNPALSDKLDLRILLGVACTPPCSSFASRISRDACISRYAAVALNAEEVIGLPWFAMTESTLTLDTLSGASRLMVVGGSRVYAAREVVLAVQDVVIGVLIMGVLSGVAAGITDPRSGTSGGRKVLALPSVGRLGGGIICISSRVCTCALKSSVEPAQFKPACIV